MIAVKRKYREKGGPGSWEKKKDRRDPSATNNKLR